MRAESFRARARTADFDSVQLPCSLFVSLATRHGHGGASFPHAYARVIIVH